MYRVPCTWNFLSVSLQRRLFFYRQRRPHRFHKHGSLGHILFSDFHSFRRLLGTLNAAEEKRSKITDRDQLKTMDGETLTVSELETVRFCSRIARRCFAQNRYTPLRADAHVAWPTSERSFAVNVSSRVPNEINGFRGQADTISEDARNGYGRGWKNPSVPVHAEYGPVRRRLARAVVRKPCAGKRRPFVTIGRPGVRGVSAFRWSGRRSGGTRHAPVGPSEKAATARGDTHFFRAFRPPVRRPVGDGAVRARRHNLPPT